MNELISKVKFTAKVLSLGAAMCGIAAVLVTAVVGLPLWVGATAGFIGFTVMCSGS